MIKGRLIKNQGYGFITVIFLVLALSCLSILAFINQRDTDKLAKAVGDLAETRSSIDRVDDAIRLLYAAENNCRLYILQKDSVFAVAYQQQLEQVSVILDSISESDKFPENEQVEGLVTEKANKTKQYIKARLLLDSLLQLSESELHTHDNIEQSSAYSVTHPLSVQADTTLERIVLPAIPKRKLFRRLKDAITNKQYNRVNQTIVVHQKSLDSVYQVKKQDLKDQTNALQEQAALFMALKSKERALLSANHNLLQSLQNILSSLKSTIVDQQEKKKMLLSKNAFSIASDIRFGNTLLIIFGLLLTLIIIWILQRLFKNSNQLKRAKEKAEEYAHLKSEFAETMSHEIRTPLHSITRFANELSADHKSAEQSEVIDAIKLSSGMLLSVVNNILDYTKMEKGKFKLAETPFNPMLVIREVLLGLQLQAKSKNLQLEEALDNQLNTSLLGDAFQLRQLLINLLSNAIKYTESGSIRIAASLHKKTKDSCVMALAIKDTGIGIDGSVDAKVGGSIFDAYVTAIHRREIKEGSTGLGLSIVKKVVALHKGKINVESIKDKGTTFYIELPYLLDNNVQAPINPLEPELSTENIKIPENNKKTKHEMEGTLLSSSLNQTTGQPNEAFSKSSNQIQQPIIANILVVDNDILNRTYMAMLLKRKGYQVIESSGAEDALNKLKSQQLDLVITDISMPGMSGYQLAATIRSNEGMNQKIPILGVSGQKPESQNSRQLTVENFNGWLLKPFEPSQLFELVTLVVKNRQVLK
ncbi:Signal transduction histidine kinase [Arachidicoccus rhizosphaerae]|uniref:histidine kinase n=1 Tax=Arachidicoccus rhizosphaerae TaxID=551991 RepID=A0A1H3Z5A8_9BACT|nr:ATP-binding protein [Arachidicoccus rhizosphaerae]SEA18678.1 Signal transduction histidine kinase [Arachidicoccus rhizosphaerae]